MTDAMTDAMSDAMTDGMTNAMTDAVTYLDNLVDLLSFLCSADHQGVGLRILSSKLTCQKPISENLSASHTYKSLKIIC
jgi:hypothetical protein